MLRVEQFAGSAAEWDSCVVSATGWTPFHRWGWKPVIEKLFGHECLYLAARNSAGALEGVLPLVHVKSLIFGDYLVSMPFVNFGGPLGSEAAVHALVQHATDIARTRRIGLLELRSREALPLDVPVSHRKITCMLDLTPGKPRVVWDGLSSNVRRKVRRAEKEGFTVKFGNEPDQLDGFYQVFSRHMRDLGTPTLPRRFFAALVDAFPEEVCIGCAYFGDRPVAAGFGFEWSGELELTWVSALQEYHRSYANMLLYWRYIERAAARDLAVFNFGRCTPGGGTHRFKQQWGSRDVPLMWYQPVVGRRTATPSPHEGAFALGPFLWKRLPLAVANALGPAIVRMIP